MLLLHADTRVRQAQRPSALVTSLTSMIGKTAGLEPVDVGILDGTARCFMASKTLSFRFFVRVPVWTVWWGKRYPRGCLTIGLILRRQARSLWLRRACLSSPTLGRKQIDRLKMSLQPLTGYRTADVRTFGNGNIFQCVGPVGTQRSGEEGVSLKLGEGDCPPWILDVVLYAW